MKIFLKIHPYLWEAHTVFVFTDVWWNAFCENIKERKINNMLSLIICFELIIFMHYAIGSSKKDIMTHFLLHHDLS